jgi:hypothetical protein
LSGSQWLRPTPDRADVRALQNAAASSIDALVGALSGGLDSRGAGASQHIAERRRTLRENATMTQEMNMRRRARASSVGWLVTLACGLSACGGDAERAAQSARLATLEQEVRQLGDSVAALKTAAPAHDKPAPVAGSPALAFRVACPQPWSIHLPLGAALWSCRAPEPAPQGLYAQCNVVFQPQLAIETKNYFEFALNASPPLLEVKNLKDKPTKINGADGFEATFEADPKPVPLKMLSALMPHGEATYAITCFAPSAAFDTYSKAFRQIIDTFAFN